MIPHVWAIAETLFSCWPRDVRGDLCGNDPLLCPNPSRAHELICMSATGRRFNRFVACCSRISSRVGQVLASYTKPHPCSLQSELCLSLYQYGLGYCNFRPTSQVLCWPESLATCKKQVDSNHPAAAAQLVAEMVRRQR